jgi:hypothetical protein
MSSYNIIQPIYSDWKTARTTLAGTTYYVQHDLHYLGILIKSVSGIIDVYLVELTRTPEDTNTADFETNVKSSATLVVSVDDAITKATV